MGYVKMTRRKSAKKAILRLSKKLGVTEKTDLRFNHDAEHRLHYMLEEAYGYDNAGTRRCIINEAFRENGSAPFRDTMRTKVYRFEDYIAAPKMPQKVFAELSVDSLYANATRACKAFGIDTPTIRIGTSKTKSYAVGKKKVVIGALMNNAFILLHELAHILDCALKQARGHGETFVAFEFLLWHLFGFLDIQESKRLAEEARIPYCAKTIEELTPVLINNVHGD